MAALLACSFIYAQDEPTSAMVFETYEWDFGDIEEADGPVSHTFRFVNISNNPIEIANIATSCGKSQCYIGELEIHGKADAIGRRAGMEG